MTDAPNHSSKSCYSIKASSLRALCAVALALLAACGQMIGTRPISGPTGRSTNPVVTVVVRPGDTIYTLAQQHSVPLRALIEANRLAPPYQIDPGRVLQLPQQNNYTVVAGDTVYGISRRFGVDMSSLTRLNGVEPPFTLRVGQVLTLPAPVVGQVAAVPPAAIPAPVPGGPAVDAPPPVDAARPSVSATPLPPPAAASGTDTSATEPPANPPQPQAAVSVPEAKPEPPAVSSPSAIPAPASPPPVPSAARPAAVPSAPMAAVPPRTGRGFLWPVNGKVVSDFGAKGGGLHNDGINIAVPRGTSVRAADAGIVAYAGNELRGFGNLLLIKHADGWVTAYAHNDRLLVKRGETVRRGQAIAHVGATGSVGTPQLHFEIRRGPQAVDPRRYLSDSGV